MIAHISYVRSSTHWLQKVKEIPDRISSWPPLARSVSKIWLWPSANEKLVFIEVDVCSRRVWGSLQQVNNGLLKPHWAYSYSAWHAICCYGAVHIARPRERAKYNLDGVVIFIRALLQSCFILPSTSLYPYNLNLCICWVVLLRQCSSIFIGLSFLSLFPSRT